MRIFVTANFVPDNTDYLTAGKEYELTDFEPCQHGGWFGYVQADYAPEEPTGIATIECPHLNGGNWTVRIEE